MEDTLKFILDQIESTFDKIKNGILAPLLFKPLKQNVSEKILEAATDLSLNLLIIFEKLIQSQKQNNDNCLTKDIKKLNLQFVSIKSLLNERGEILAS